MKNYTPTPKVYSNAPRGETRGGGDIASPLPLGMSILAFTTAVLSCIYAGFLIPFGAGGGSHSVVGVLLLIGGIILVLAGMWEFRKDNTFAATLFTTYGGFTAAIGLAIFAFVPPGSTIAPLGTPLGLLFLCWTIFNAVLLFAAHKQNANMWIKATLWLMFIAFVLLTLGLLIAFNPVLLRIGGWIGIIAALCAWYVSLLSLTNRDYAPLPHRTA